MIMASGVIAGEVALKFAVVRCPRGSRCCLQVQHLIPSDRSGMVKPGILDEEEHSAEMLEIVSR